MSTQTLPNIETDEIISYDPSTGDEIGRVPLMNASDVADAVSWARAAQPAWARLSYRSRAEYILRARERDPRIKLITFSRRFGQPMATLAGLQYSRGDAVIVMDVDLQDPPELLHAMVAKWREGYDVVLPQRRQREGEPWLKRLVARVGYRVINKIADVNIPPNTGENYRQYLELWKEKDLKGWATMQPNWLGGLGVYASVMALEGKDVPEFVEVPLPIITNDNLDEYLARADQFPADGYIYSEYSQEMFDQLLFK